MGEKFINQLAEIANLPRETLLTYQLQVISSEIERVSLLKRLIASDKSCAPLHVAKIGTNIFKLTFKTPTAKEEFKSNLPNFVHLAQKVFSYWADTQEQDLHKVKKNIEDTANVKINDWEVEFINESITGRIKFTSLKRIPNESNFNVGNNKIRYGPILPKRNKDPKSSEESVKLVTDYKKPASSKLDNITSSDIINPNNVINHQKILEEETDLFLRNFEEVSKTVSNITDATNKPICDAEKEIPRMISTISANISVEDIRPEEHHFCN